YRKKSASTVDLDFTLADNVHENTLFIVDEASMISDNNADLFSNSLLDDLIRFVQSGNSCCLMFVGDSAQLPPVGMIQSPALDVGYLSSKYHLHTYSYEIGRASCRDRGSTRGGRGHASTQQRGKA